MPAATEELRNAQALAEFSNLGPEQIDYFRNNFPDFFPDAWWNYESSWKEKQWVLSQSFIRYSWEIGFGGKDGVHRLVVLMMLVFDPDDLTLGLDSKDGERPDFRPALGNIYEVGGGIHWHKAVVPSYQKAVAYLFNDPWRARFCAECNKRFVAAEPKNKFCSESCAHEHRNRQKRDNWNKYGKQQRQQRRNNARQTA
jgi:hypothetical protein